MIRITLDPSVRPSEPLLAEYVLALWQRRGRKSIAITVKDGTWSDAGAQFLADDDVWVRDNCTSYHPLERDGQVAEFIASQTGGKIEYPDQDYDESVVY